MHAWIQWNSGHFIECSRTLLRNLIVDIYDFNYLRASCFPFEFQRSPNPLHLPLPPLHLPSPSPPLHLPSPSPPPLRTVSGWMGEDRKVRVEKGQGKGRGGGGGETREAGVGEGWATHCQNISLWSWMYVLQQLWSQLTDHDRHL